MKTTPLAMVEKRGGTMVPAEFNDWRRSAEAYVCEKGGSVTTIYAGAEGDARLSVTLKNGWRLGIRLFRSDDSSLWHFQNPQGKSVHSPVSTGIPGQRRQLAEILTQLGNLPENP